MAKKNYYSVARGRVPGIYMSWPEAQKQVSGYKGAVYKGFATRSEAEAYIQSRPKPRYWQASKTASKKHSTPATPVPNDGRVHIFSDGGSIGNPGPGGWGVVILDGDRQPIELQDGYIHTTNNRMELMGCIAGIQQAVSMSDRLRQMVVTTDSKYVVNGISKGWAEGWREKGWKKSDGKPALNADLWEELLELIEVYDVDLQWVKGHAGHPYNERCDELAGEAMRRPTGELKTDHGDTR